MPITIGHSWSQDKKTIFLDLELRGVKKEDIDIYITPLYFKVNSKPFIFETDLRYPVDDLNSSAKYDQNGLHISLMKKEDQIWDDLRTDLRGEEKYERRKKSIREKEDKEQNIISEKKKKKEKDSKRLFHKQWDLESEEKKELEQRKQNVKEELTSNVEKWAHQKSEETSKEKVKEQNISLPEHGEEKPGIRESGDPIKVSFSKRLLRTPAREEKDEEFEKKYEQAKKLREMQQKEETKDKEEEQEEQQQTGFWLKEKGDKLFQAGNTSSAINIYTTALRKDPTLFTAYLNRAICFLSIANLDKCIEDCTTALQLVSLSPLSQEKKNQAKITSLLRRGYARFMNEDLQNALNDYKEAFAIDPNNTSIEEDLNSIKKKLEEN
eukprot:gb/GECH01009357.1/.p1 GENE.gb/GECH01009357.1/~~gb/GECH01009357.1/.p1  ORF type:complete len:381 (+),score=117.72 gb/GECH01009357.1/:1-1143(+)